MNPPQNKKIKIIQLIMKKKKNKDNYKTFMHYRT